MIGFPTACRERRDERRPPLRGGRRRRLRRAFSAAGALALALAVAAPAAAYVIYLKDGSKILADSKYQVRDGKAYITLSNGTRTFIAASEIDVPRTERANRDNYGTAVVIDGDKVTESKPPPPPPQKTLGDLIRDNGSLREPAAEDHAGRSARARQPDAGQTLAGYPDFASLPRRGFSDIDTAAALKDFFAAQGVDNAEIFQGTEPDLPLVEVTTASEASVLRAVATAAAALLHLREQGGTTPAVELYLATPSTERAGQFKITPQMAADLVANRVDITQFYVAFVQF